MSAAPTHLIASAGYFCSEAEADDARRFFAERVDKLLGGPRELALALESSALCVALSRAQQKSAQSYFAPPAKTSAKSPARAASPLSVRDAQGCSERRLLYCRVHEESAAVSRHSCRAASGPSRLPRSSDAEISGSRSMSTCSASRRSRSIRMGSALTRINSCSASAPISSEAHGSALRARRWVSASAGS